MNLWFLVSGTVIDVIDTPDEGWWKGRIDGREGLFPSNFVQPLETPSLTEPPNKPCPDPSMVIYIVHLYISYHIKF